MSFEHAVADSRTTSVLRVGYAYPVDSARQRLDLDLLVNCQHDSRGKWRHPSSGSRGLQSLNNAGSGSSKLTHYHNAALVGPYGIGLVPDVLFWAVCRQTGTNPSRQLLGNRVNWR
jgi:hypothetical protein